MSYLLGGHRVNPICGLWCEQELKGVDLTKEQKELIDKGYSGPPVAFDDKPFTNDQVHSNLPSDANLSYALALVL